MPLATQLHSLRDAAAMATAGYAYVPVVRTIPADTLTPVGALLALRRRGGPCFLLESVIGGEHLARYSFAGCNVVGELRIEGDRAVHLAPNGDRSLLGGEPWEALGAALSAARAPDVAGLPPFAGGAVGYLGYEVMHFIEPKVPMRTGELPVARLPLFSTVIAFDHLAQRLVLVRWVAAAAAGLDARLQAAEADLEALERDVQASRCGPWLPPRAALASERLAMEEALTAEGYQAAVRALKRSIRAGDIFQAVLANRFALQFRVDPLWVYRAVRSLNPSPYMFFLDLGDMALVGSSPEMLVRVEGRSVETRPIAGTRPRGRTEEEDRKYASQLVASIKERAEHVMLVDLGRNDLGRVCRGGSVHVPAFMTIERYSHVMHIVSSVAGELAPTCTAWDALASCFPAGTVSGAPKIHAMELLAELEPVPRGAYSGAVVYRDFRGGLDSAIAIRCLTAIRRDDAWTGYVQAGAGIVFDSNPASEWAEVCHKAGAMMDAVAWAEAAQLSGALSER